MYKIIILLHFLLLVSCHSFNIVPLEVDITNDEYVVTFTYRYPF